MSRSADALEQLAFLRQDLSAAVHGRPSRWLTCWFGESTAPIVAYRISRALFLLLGRPWRVVRVMLLPFMLLVRPWFGRCDIDYRARIGGGLLVLHPALGLVISARAVIGSRFTVTGGNCIGLRGGKDPGSVTIGDGVVLGANAVIIGPLHVGNAVTIGAGAVVVDSVPDGAIVAGVPARVIGPPLSDQMRWTMELRFSIPT